MDTQSTPYGHGNGMGLNSTEIDTIGEILNISMGAAATAVSILLNRQVIITTPNVHVVKSTSFEFSRLEPALGIEIKYIHGLYGSNHMIMSVKDIRAIVQLLLGEDFGETSSEAELDEIHVSALGEVMNQMMGASCTALASFLDREINISPPAPFDISSATDKPKWYDEQESIVSISFKLTIEGLIDSEFVTVMPIPFAKELVSSTMGMSGETASWDNEQDSPQITGHTQVPAPVHEDDYQPAARNTAKSKPVPASNPAPVETTRPAPAAMPNQATGAAQRPASVPAPKPVPAAVPDTAPIAMSDPAPAAAYNPAPAPAYNPTPVPAYNPAPAPAYNQAPAPAYNPAPAPAYNPAPAAAYNQASTPAYNQAPMAMQRSAPAGGYAMEKAVPQQNVVVKPLQFASLDSTDSFAEEMDSVNLGLVMGVDLNVTVEIGRTKKQVKEILSLRQGSIVELDKQAGAPVDIMVNGKLIARGDVVVIDDNFGVRITEIVSAAAIK